MATLLVTHPASLDHLTPTGHPERPDRVRAVERALAQGSFASLRRELAPAASVETIALCHPTDYVEAIREATPTSGLARIDADTTMSPGSFEAAIRGAGGAVYAIDEVMTGKAAECFRRDAPARPSCRDLACRWASACSTMPRSRPVTRRSSTAPSASRSSISTCITATARRRSSGATRRVMYCSTHQMPLYPGTGAVNESGEHDTIVNAPLRAGDGGEPFRAAFESRILPRLNDFRPDLVIISAGFDAHMRDPLANLNLIEPDFAWATREADGGRRPVGRGRVVSVLEGGYDLEGLANSAAVHVRR